MLTEQFISGLKNFFKEEQLSDRILQIVEINEDFRATSKRKTSDSDCCLEVPSKKLKYVEEQSEEESVTSSIENQHEEDLIAGSSNNDRYSETISDTERESELYLHEPENDLRSPILSEKQSNSSSGKKKLRRRKTQDTKILNLGGRSLSDEVDENVIATSSSYDNEKCFATFPIHSIVLCINSNYFKKLLVESGMKETTMRTVVVKVNHGEGKYLQMLVEAFYDHDILKKVSLADLLNILDIAARFSCSIFIKYGICELKEKQVTSVKECDSILKHISRVFEVFDNDGQYKKLKDSCLKLLAKTLYPLEFKLSEQDMFISLNHATVIYLLNSNHPFTIQENNKLLFVYLWLLHNSESQTSEKIEALLTSIQYESLNENVLCDQLSLNDTILQKWSGYSEWLVNSLKHRTLTHEQLTLRGMKGKQTVFLAKSNNNLVKAKKHFVYQSSSQTFCDRSMNSIVWGGLQLCPVLSLREHDGEFFIRFKLLCMSVYSPGPNFEHFHQKYNIYISLIPGNVIFKDSMYQSKRYVQRYIRKGEVQFKSKCSYNFRVIAKIEHDFMESIERYGVNLVIFFKTSSFSWNVFEAFDVKSTKKMITLKTDDFLSEF